MVNGGSPSAAAAIGGATGHREPTVARAHRLGSLTRRAPEHLGVGRRRRAGANDCTGLRATTVWPVARSASMVAAVNHVLPTSVPVPVTTTIMRSVSDRLRKPSSTSAATSRSICSAVCAAESAMRRRAVPTGTVGGRIAGTSNPRSSSAAAASRARRSSPHTTGTIGEPWPGRSRSTCARRRATRPAPSALVSTPRAASAAAVSAGVDAVVKMYERARLTISAASGADAATNPPSEPSVFESVPTLHDVDVVGKLGRHDRPEHGVGLVEHEQRSVAGAASAAEAVEVGEVAVHREDGVGDDERAPAAAPREQPVEVVEVGVAVDRDRRVREPATVDDRRVVQLVGAHEHVARRRS